jgi:endonuclease-8
MPIRATSPQGRFSAGAAQLDGRVLERSTAAGKHLFVEFGNGVVLHVHLGLIGQFPVRPIEPGPLADPVGAVRLRIVGERQVADLRGPMICVLITPERMDEVTAALGPDPLDPSADGDRAWERIRLSRKAIGELLMNQSFVAGVGNVYRCEVLHRHRVDPFTPGRELSRGAWQSLWRDLVDLLPLGVAFAQILTMKDQVDEAKTLVADGTAASHAATLTGERLGDWFERRFYTYQRTGQACLRCGGIIQSRRVAGRTLYWCPTCQTER